MKDLVDHICDKAKDANIKYILKEIKEYEKVF
jgi:hypothetical protein